MVRRRRKRRPRRNEVLKTLLLLLIALHVAAALVHQFIFKTNLMARMKRPVG